MPDKEFSPLISHREHLDSLDRPRLREGAPSIKTAVAAIREMEDLWRVYAPAWGVRFVAYDLPAGEEARARCLQEYAKKYEGRVAEEDVKVEDVYGRTALFLRVPTLMGEFKTLERAESFAALRGFDSFEIVSRSSRREFEIRDYGVKKIIRK